MSKFALRLKELRTNKKMSQKELADYLGMKRENISNYERGTVTNVSSDTLNKLSDLFNTSVDYLLGRIDDPDPIAPALRDFEEVELDDENENELIAAFRLESEDMTDEEKKKFNDSLKGMMKIAKGLLNDDSKWKE